MGATSPWHTLVASRVSPKCPLTPFTLSRCAELLLAHGAQVNLGTRDRQVTALHVAARQGLVAHVELYLHHGADPSQRTHQGETPLNAAAAAAERPEDAERFLRVAERLLAAGAEPGAAGRKGHTPLHNACANGHPALARLLLRHGADATVPNSAGDTPLDCALHAVHEYREQRPEETLALLLDHGALPAHPKVWTGVTGGAGWRRWRCHAGVTRLCWQMLRLCCQHPPALEVMLNAYDRVPPAEGWVETVPPELWEVRGCPGVCLCRSPSPLSPVSPRAGAPGVLCLGRAHGGAATAAPAPGTCGHSASPGRPLSHRCPQAGTPSPPAPLPPAAHRGAHLLRAPHVSPLVFPSCVPFMCPLHVPHRCPLVVSPPCPSVNKGHGRGGS